MSHRISECSDEQSRLKTIVSEDPTRHPTTIKKKPRSPSSSSKPKYIQKSPIKKQRDLKRSISLFQSKKVQCLQKNRYEQALKLEIKISHTRQQLEKTSISRLKTEQTREEMLIQEAYRQELKYFHMSWKKSLNDQKQKRIKTLQKFRKDQVKSIEKSRLRVASRCKSLANKTAEIISLEKEEEYYLQKKDAKKLSLIKLEKDKAKVKLRRQRELLISRWTQEQQQFLKERQAKQYAALIARLTDKQKDQQRLYLQEKQRLKQKFKNVITQLRHQQRMMLHFINLRPEQIRVN